jgi:ParB/RepB/Spo0J family partition protein
LPRVLRPGTTRASTLRRGAEAEARRQIDQARYGQQLVLDVGDVEPNPNNPRRTFSDEALNQLAESMKRDGQIQPVVVRRVGSTWQLIAGERRWRAARLAGVPGIAAVQREATDEAAFRLALVENIHREDLSHQEKVEALDMLAQMVEGGGLRRTAIELNMSPGWLSRRLSMRRDPIVFPALEEGRITFGQAHELLSAPAITRRTLLDRVLRARKNVPNAEVRAWVKDVRQESRNEQQRIVADLASAPTAVVESTGARTATEPDEPITFARLLALVRALGEPRTDEEIEAVGELTVYVQQLWARFRPRRAKAPPPASVRVRAARAGRAAAP